MKYLKDQKGATLVLELVLFAIVVVLAGFAVFNYMNGTKKVASSTTPSPSPAHSVSPTPTPVSYAGWKTFCSSKTNACFKYDPSWTFSECAPVEVNIQNFQNCPSTETVSVIAPGKTIRVEWFLDPYNATKTDICTQGKSSFPGTTYSGITQVPDAPNIFFVNVKNSGSTIYDYTGFLALTTGNNGQPPTVGQSGALCPPDPSFLSQDGKYKITFNYGYAVNTNPNLPAADQSHQPSQTDLNSVKQTLLSFYYK